MKNLHGNENKNSDIDTDLNITSKVLRGSRSQ